MKKKNPRVDEFIRKGGKWQAAFKEMRSILLETPLTEDFKWRGPCYTVENANVVAIQGFKDYCAVMFFKGALLKDPKGILVQLSESTQSIRQVRFTDARQITPLRSVLKAYVQLAIQVEKSGLKVQRRKTSEYAVAEEFQAKLDAMPALKKAFEALTPGRQRAYLLHFSGAKQSSTRAARVAKCIPRILKGKGLDDDQRR